MGAKKKASKKTTKKKVAKKVKKKTPVSKKSAAKKSKKKVTKAKKTPAKKTKKKVKKKAVKKVVKKATKKTATKASSKKVAAKSVKKTTKKTTATKKKNIKKVAKKETVKKTKPIKAKATSSETSKLSKVKKSVEVRSTKKVNKAELPTKAKQVTVEKKVPLKEDSVITPVVKDAGKESLLENWKKLKNDIFSLEFFEKWDFDECKIEGCENLATTLGHCRLHYISEWKLIHQKRKILESGELQSCLIGLIKKYPRKYIQTIYEDLIEEKDFFAVLKELNIDVNVEDNGGGSGDELDSGEEGDISIETRDYSRPRKGTIEEDSEA